MGCPLSLEQVMRIELTTTAWEAVVLPLNYTCTSQQTPLTSVCLTTNCKIAPLLLLFPKNLLQSKIFSGALLFLLNKLRSLQFVLQQTAKSLHCYLTILPQIHNKCKRNFIKNIDYIKNVCYNFIDYILGVTLWHYF